MSITIPIAIVTDLALGKNTPGYESAIGAVLVIIGFLLVNVDKATQDQYLNVCYSRMSDLLGQNNRDCLQVYSAVDAKDTTECLST